MPDKPLRADLHARLLRARLNRAQRAVAELIPLFPDETLLDPQLALVVEAAEALQRLHDLVAGSEPAWMQDVRAAQRKIEAKRRAKSAPIQPK